MVRSVVGPGLVLLMAASIAACERQPSQRPSSPPPDAAAGRVPEPSQGELARLLLTADSAFQRQSTDSADSIWQAVLDAAARRGDSASIARAWTGRALAERRRLALGESRRLGEAALALKLRLGMRSDLPRSHNQLGLIAWDEGRLPEALEHFGRMEEVARVVLDSVSIAKAQVNVALVLRDFGDLQGARSSLRRGIDVARALHDTSTLGRAVNNQAALDLALGDALSALASVETARHLIRASGDSMGEVNALGQLATVYDALGEPQRAFAALDSALRKARRSGFRKEEAEDLTLLGHFYAAAADHERALEAYGRAAIAYGTISMPEERGNLLRSQATSELALGRASGARRLAAHALQLHRAGRFGEAELYDLLLLAETELAGGRPQEADARLREARTVAARLRMSKADAYLTLTEARVADRLGESTRTLRALDAAHGTLEVAGLEVAAEGAALRLRAHAREGRLEAAAAAGRLAVAALERLRGNYGSGELRTRFTSRRSDVYAALAMVYLRMGRTREAFEVSDAARGRALLDHLATARAELAASPGAARSLLEGERLLGTIDTLVTKLRALERTDPRQRAALTSTVSRQLATRIASARSEYETIMATAAREQRGLVLLGGAQRTAAQVQQALAPDEALLEYLVADDRLLIFIVRRSQLASITIDVGLRELMARTRLARDLMSGPGSGTHERPVLEGLHDLLIAPVTATGALRGARRLLIARHSVLSYLPFAALRDRTTGRYLAETHALRYVPSASAFTALRGAHAPEEVSATSAPVAFAPFPLRLPGTRAEAMGFAASVRGGRATLGSAATERRVRRAIEGADVVHVATHGVMNPRNPLFSRIELAPAPNAASDDNGRLEVHEILALRVRSPLVFLSGCETGLGDAWSTSFQPGEDYATLAQAFLYAGAKTVVATLWRIDDEATAILVRAFYATAGDPAEALARAQRALLATHERRAPYYWAAFEVHGATGIVRPDGKNAP